MHATEEAVAAFISAAKAHGPKTHAKQVNLHDHTSKALVSIYAQRLTILIAQGDLAISWNPKNNALAYRIMLDHEYRYGDLHLSVFRTQKGPDGTKDGYAEIGNLPSVDELLEEAKRVADIRNKLLYASNTGIPTGFINVDDALDREAKLSLGLIWAAIDLHMHPKQDASFLNQILKDMASFSSVSKKILPN
ncbi:hypothetical protein [Frigidibacter sp.]|uniref:hypothetical protein n=1 Tax=Frigidibacter sp. TaxID=2586418 RepID=UPI002736EFB7|nr:hypothetical protein [Frigidibacter sp.]MDP3341984.1 hypothetical protein [Frigidibacter sp.]